MPFQILVASKGSINPPLRPMATQFLIHMFSKQPALKLKILSQLPEYPLLPYVEVVLKRIVKNIECVSVFNIELESVTSAPP